MAAPLPPPKIAPMIAPPTAEPPMRAAERWPTPRPRGKIASVWIGTDAAIGEHQRVEADAEAGALAELAAGLDDGDLTLCARPRRDDDGAVHPHVAGDVSLDALFDPRGLGRNRVIELQPNHRVRRQDQFLDARRGRRRRLGGRHTIIDASWLAACLDRGDVVVRWSTTAGLALSSRVATAGGACCGAERVSGRVTAGLQSAAAGCGAGLATGTGAEPRFGAVAVGVTAGDAGGAEGRSTGAWRSRSWAPRGPSPRFH